jgi:hypothetical protein
MKCGREVKLHNIVMCPLISLQSYVYFIRLVSTVIRTTSLNNLFYVTVLVYPVNAVSLT